MDLVEIRSNYLDWFGLAQDMYKWRALVNFGFHRMPGSNQVATQLVASRIVLSSTELVSCTQYSNFGNFK
jgi:hypothetical protein